MKTKIYLVFLLFAVAGSVFGQSGYKFRRKVSGVKDLWHSIPFPNDLYATYQQSNDCRIIGIDFKSDTIEVPYFVNVNAETVQKAQVTFKLLNQTHNEKGYFYTFETVNSLTLNEILLNFSDKNFDWKTDLSGSEDQREWFSIVEDQRLVGIKNGKVDYHYTNLYFADAKYRYWRVCVKTNTKPNFINAELILTKTESSKLVSYIVDTDIQQDKPKKLTIITVQLSDYSPISSLNVPIKKDRIDFIRNVRFEYLSNTTKPYWTEFYAAKLSSFERNELSFETIFTQKIRLIVENNDNALLNIGDIGIKGNVYEFIARFTESADYYLYYGKNAGSSPQYDIEQFKQNVPTTKKALTLGNEEKLIADTVAAEPFFKNKWWLWGIMLSIIAVLGWQTFKMMKTQ